MEIKSHYQFNQRSKAMNQTEIRGDDPLAKFKELIKSRRFTDDEVMKLGDKLGRDLVGRAQENTTTQVRRFYNLVRSANTQALAKDADNNEESTDEIVRIKLRTLQAQVTYAAARKTISNRFKTFFDASLDRIIGSKEIKKELDAFTTFFEALYAYFYYHAEQGKQPRR
ncbi:MAG: type III-A CRISPR-associated protein Csm2 [Acidobacteria bacterium]|nr:type III-A CRISPR-associated protein Csm2 [Acidobacteriota bacterium]